MAGLCLVRFIRNCLKEGENAYGLRVILFFVWLDVSFVHSFVRCSLGFRWVVGSLDRWVCPLSAMARVSNCYWPKGISYFLLCGVTVRVVKFEIR